MSSFAIMRSPRTEINDTPIVDGQFFIETDQTVNNLYNDNNDNRVILGRYDWTKLVEKPFETLGDRLTVISGLLNADIQNWNIIVEKPFESIGNGLTITNNILKADDVSWDLIKNKPFITIGDRLTVTNNILNADIQNWNTISSKPFVTLDSNSLNVTNDVLSANNQIWSRILGKPFTDLGIGLNVKADGTLYATGGIVGGIDWSSKILNKPFETLGSTLSVDSNDELIVGNINWSNVGVKPFNTIGAGLQVIDDVLILDVVYWNGINNKPFNSIGTGLSINADELVLDTVSWTNVSYKPFNTLGSGLDVNNNDELLTNVQTITLSQVGTASDTNFSRQELNVNNNASPIEIIGTKYMEKVDDLNSEQAVMFIFLNQEITTNSSIDVMTLLNNVDNTKTLTYNIIPSNVSVVNGQCVVTYPASDLGSITCRIYIL